MIRLARRATLIVALSLLASAATAYAECAWVLWEQINTQGSQPTPTGAFVTAQACSLKLRELAQTGREQKKSVGYTGGALFIGEFTDQMMFTCLPDTVDPRGPKTK
jgi:hypothetical protein